jgi:hypothetical protein
LLDSTCLFRTSSITEIKVGPQLPEEVATRPYTLENWNKNFFFFTQYLYPHESRVLPPTYEAHIEEYFQAQHPKEAEFLFARVSAMIRFLAKNIGAFAFAGTPTPASEGIDMGPAVRFSLWLYFLADGQKFDPEPDPQAVLELGELAAKSGLVRTDRASLQSNSRGPESGVTVDATYGI